MSPNRFTLVLLTSVVTGAGAYFSCNKPTEPPPNGQAALQLTALDASCVESWLAITLAAGASPRTVTLLRDSLPILTTTLDTTDTLIVDEGLLPNRRYTYTLTRATGLFTERATATITTMDTTSHNFTFQIDTLGVTSSVLYDVAIVRADPDSPLVWTVGELYLNEPNRYNAAVWDGNTWTIIRVPYYYQGQPFYHPIQTIFAFGPNDIWFAGNGVIRWNGQQYIPMEIPSSVWGPNRINKIWGSSSNDLYIVGDNGSIAHYSSGTWRRVASGTTLPIKDIWGSLDQKTNEWEILCIASNQFINEGKRLLRVRSTGVVELPDSGLSWALNTVWHIPGRKYFIGGDGLYQSRTLGPIWYRDISFPSYYKTSVRGVGLYDVVVVGAFGLLIHYNGATWRNFHEQTYMANGAFGRVDMKGNLVVAVGGVTVGSVENKAVALIGLR